MAAGDFELAAARYAELGSVPDEAFARLRAGERLLAAGRRSEGDRQLEQALAFYREVGPPATCAGAAGCAPPRPSQPGAHGLDAQFAGRGDVVHISWMVLAFWWWVDRLPP